MAAIQGDWCIGHSDSESYPVKDQMRCVFANQADGDRFIVAKVWSDGEGDYESTARLIAAAPKMLAALRAAVAILSGWEATSRIDAGDTETVRLCKQALAKAEGDNARVVRSAPQCCICGGPIAAVSDAWRDGHNAQPVSDGRCCDSCNQDVVIPARLEEFDKRRNQP